MPLNHLGSDDSEVIATPTRAGLRPVSQRARDMEQETFSPVATTRDLPTADPERFRIDPSDSDSVVKKEAKKLAALVAAGASGQVLSRARARLHDARVDYFERESLKQGQVRQKALEEQKTKARAKIEREHLHRMDGWAQCAVKIGKVVITTKIDRNMESSARLTALNDIRTVALQIASREGERMAALAKQEGPIEQDTVALIAEIRDRMRRSIATGDTEISEL